MPEPLRPAEAPIVEDDALIAEALENANIPTLMVAIAQTTGCLLYTSPSPRA